MLLHCIHIVISCLTIPATVCLQTLSTLRLTWLERNILHEGKSVQTVWQTVFASATNMWNYDIETGGRLPCVVNKEAIKTCLSMDADIVFQFRRAFCVYTAWAKKNRCTQLRTLGDKQLAFHACSNIYKG